MEIKETIAKWIKAARVDAELSGDELAAKLSFALGTTKGNSKANISHWETQKHSPSLEQILAIVKVTKFGLPSELLVAMGLAVPQRDADSPTVELEESADQLEPRKVRQSPNPGMQFVGEEEYYLLDLFRCVDDTGREDILSFAERIPRIVGPLASVRDKL